MKKITRRSFLLASGALAASALAGCSTAGPASSAVDSSSTVAVEPAVHAPITILTASRDYSAFVQLLHDTYPEINVQFLSYRGQNTSAYMKKQLETGCMPDIYTSTYFWDSALQAEHLIDLSRYSITDQYIPFQMAQTDVDGATYLLPYDYAVQAIGYNKTLFARQGWAVPQSLAEVQALLPAMRAAGITPAVCQMGLPGNGFQEFCNIADTVFLNTLEGRRWQQEFLSGQADTSALQNCADIVQQWINAGLLNMDHPAFDEQQANALFREGHTAFLLGTLECTTQNEDGTGDQYGILPYFSPDGTTNAYVLRVLRYYGLNKTLEDPGNEQKLEDALHFLEVLSTVDGCRSVVAGPASPLYALKDFTVPETSLYCDALQAISCGHSAPFLYAGWEDPAVAFGNAVRCWAAGSITGAQALRILDETQQQHLAGGTPVYATVAERLNTRQTAQLIGQMYISQTGADAALISCNEWKPCVSALYENVSGVSGELLPGDLTEQDIVSILPTGWYGTIPLVRLGGARIRELALNGFDQNGDQDTYPYVLVTRNNKELASDTLYTVAYAGLNSNTSAAVPLLDSGVNGLAAAKNYFQQTGVISSASLW